MKNLRRFFKEEDGMGTVEVVLIIVVLIALVIIFKDSIMDVVEKIMDAIDADTDTIIN